MNRKSSRQPVRLMVIQIMSAANAGMLIRVTIHKPGSTALLIGRYPKRLLVQKMENASEAAVNAA